MFTGFKRGLELIAEFMQMYRWAIKNDNVPAITDLGWVSAMWFKELTGVSIESKTWTVQVGLMAFMFGKDPFQGSREEFKRIKQRYVWPQ